MSLARPKPQREQDRAYRAWIGALPCIACACEGRASERSDCAHVSFLGSRGLGGVAIVGRPVARARDDGATLEVTRLCTDGTRNACSFLYGCCARAAHALGYARIGTYTLGSEGGASLRGAGWRLVSEVKGRSWDTPSPPAHRQASDHRQVPLGSSMTPQDQGAASPAQEPALKPEELDAAALKVAWEAHQRSPMDMCADSDEEAERVFAIGVAVYLAQARSVLPAAAPVGELSDTQIDAMAEQTFEKGGYLYAGFIQGAQTIRDMAARALAAAPVTGDRETAGVEAKENVTQQEKPMTINEIAKATRAANEARPTAEYVHRLEAALNDMKAAASDAIQALNATVERDGPMHPVAAKLCAAHGIASGHARFASEWLSKRALATPPSGGGDHAGGEASDAVTLDGGVTEAAPALGPAELSLRLEWAIDVLRVVRRIATGDASAIAQAGLDLAEADEDALLAAGSDEALASLAAARATAAPASGVEGVRLEGFTDQEGYTRTLEVEAAMEVVSMVREAAKRITGGNCTFVDDDVRALAALAASPKAQGSDVGLRKALAREERDHERTIDQRESAASAADALAQWVSRLTGAEIGEHSNLNDPWANAIEAAQEFAASRTGQKGAGS